MNTSYTINIPQNLAGIFNEFVLHKKETFHK